MAARRHPLWGAILFTGFLAALVGVAVASESYLFALVAWSMIVAAASVINWMFPRSRFFAISLANYIAVYACLYVFFIETNFQRLDRILYFPGFVLPIAGFLIGAWWQRARIRHIVETHPPTDERRFLRVFWWLLPVFLIGAFTFVLPGLQLEVWALNAVFMGAMALIGLIVMLVSRDVAAFLIETGLLFEDFFERVSGLVIPAFAFLTFYSLDVVIFGSIYRIIDRFSTARNFLINENAIEISFSDSLYFSLVTLSTVGYGDITPGTNLIKVIAAAQVVTGVMLLLFGFSEIMNYSRSNSRKNGK